MNELELLFEELKCSLEQAIEEICIDYKETIKKLNDKQISRIEDINAGCTIENIIDGFYDKKDNK